MYIISQGITSSHDINHDILSLSMSVSFCSCTADTQMVIDFTKDFWHIWDIYDLSRKVSPLPLTNKEIFTLMWEKYQLAPGHSVILLPSGTWAPIGGFLFCQILYFASLWSSPAAKLYYASDSNQIYSLCAFWLRKTEGKYQFVVLLNSWIILSDPWTNKLWCVSTLQEQK